MCSRMARETRRRGERARTRVRRNRCSEEPSDGEEWYEEPVYMGHAEIATDPVSSAGQRVLWLPRPDGGFDEYAVSHAMPLIEIDERDPIGF